MDSCRFDSRELVAWKKPSKIIPRGFVIQMFVDLINHKVELGLVVFDWHVVEAEFAVVPG
jgi:hypothetical protein